MAQNPKSYDNEFKTQAVKLAQEIGGHAEEIETLEPAKKPEDKGLCERADGV